MADTCKFRRVGGVWFMIEDCPGELTCPSLPNSRGLAPVNAPEKDNAFLESFRAALGNGEFSFENADILEIDCEGEGEHLTYSGATSATFKITGWEDGVPILEEE